MTALVAPVHGALVAPVHGALVAPVHVGSIVTNDMYIM